MSSSPETQQAVLDLARSVDLKNVRVVEFAARLLQQPPANSSASTDVNTELKTAEIPGGFVVEGSFALDAGTSSGEGSTRFLELKYRLGAVYETPIKPLPTKEVLDAFAATNGMIHLWPYFRAYVQQACAQLAVAPIVLPPFRIKPTPPPQLANNPAPEKNSASS